MTREKAWHVASIVFDGSVLVLAALALLGLIRPARRTRPAEASELAPRRPGSAQRRADAACQQPELVDAR